MLGTPFFLLFCCTGSNCLLPVHDIVVAVWHRSGGACLKLYCLVLCALCHYTQGTCTSAVGILCSHCLLLVLCTLSIHFAYYHTMYHFSTHLVCCCLLLSVMLHGHPHDAWPLSCCVAIGLLPCLCQAARLSNMLLWLYLSSCLCRAALQLPFSLLCCPAS